jgi:hypothetical protein
MIMKTPRALRLYLLLYASGMLALPTFAADAVYQRATSSGGIELSNISDDAAQAPVAVESAQRAQPAAAVPAQVAANPEPAKRAVAKRPKPKKTATDQADPNADPNAEDQEQSSDATDANADPADPKNAAASSAAGSSAVGTNAGFGFSSGYSSGGAYSAGGGSAGAQGAGTTSVATDSGAGNTAASRVPVTVAPRPDTTGGTAAAPPVSNAETAALSQYRALMLQQANAVGNTLSGTNPAISRRYLMVDRNTYQARIGQ